MRVELVSEDKTNETIARRIGDGWFLPKLPSIQDEVTVPIWTIQDVHGKHCVWNRTNNNIGQTRKLDTRPTFSTVSLYTSLLPADAASILTATNQNQGWDKTFWRDKKSCNNGTNRRASLSALLCRWSHESCVSSGRGDTGTTTEKRYTDKFVAVTSNSSSGTSLEIYTVTEE